MSWPEVVLKMWLATCYTSLGIYIIYRMFSFIEKDEFQDTYKYDTRSQDQKARQENS